MTNIIEFENEIKKYKDKFDIYYQILISYNEKVNLTAITEKEDVYIKHFLDSVLGYNFIPKNATVVDVGTGAGFPGLPLKIVRDDINLTLVDSLNKRLEFLNELTTKLGYKTNYINSENVQKNLKTIKNNQNLAKLNDNLNIFNKNVNTIYIVHSRAEDFCKLKRECFDVAVARAVARLNTLLEYLLPLVKVGGIVLAYKGSSSEEELVEAKNAIKILGGEYLKTLHFDLPNNMGERNIIVIKKIKDTPKIYPRDKNLPKLKPLI